MSHCNEVFSIGHSTLSYEEFLRLGREYGITAVADVRSAPYSRRFPHFNRKILFEELRAKKIAYVFLGDELGGRPKDPRFFCDGVADYDQMARVPEFAKGLDRVVEGANRYRIALMCSEHDPLDCHRCLLVGRALRGRDVPVTHILSSGASRTQEQIEENLLAMTGHDEAQADIFASREVRLAFAYRDRAKRVAYSVVTAPRSTTIAAE